MINAAAQKEAALAAVLEAISKFEEEQPPVVCTEIEPNQSISLSNPESITSVSFTAYTETGTTTVELYDIDELILKSVVVDDTQSTVTWTVLTNPAILKNAGNATVFVCNLIVE
ncbi:hypothetical protein SDC9_203572 [bioreactor metagenome]|uniref:Uncharacterized protein n=1 Tax=bioreactor metagenome TaxID=1076179 RepID=A0A645IWV6_9ZZZZ